MALTLPDIIDAIDVERIDSGKQPHPATIEAALKHLVRRYPNGGKQLEAALRDAILMGWRARHLFSLLRQEQPNG